MLAAATHAAPGPGWAHLVGLVVAAGIGWALIELHARLTGRKASPPPEEDDEYEVSPGETGEPDTDDTTENGHDDTSWWGRRIRQADGSTLVTPWWGRRDTADDTDDTSDDTDPDTGETRAEAADRLVSGGGAYADWVREIMGAYGVSEATAKRDIARARARL